MSWYDPWGVGKSILNVNPLTKVISPYLGEIGGVAGGVIGGFFGGPGGAAVGAGIGELGGTQLKTYLGGGNPWSGSTLATGAEKGAIAAGGAYLGGSLAQGFGGSSGAAVSNSGDLANAVGSGYGSGAGGGIAPTATMVGPTTASSGLMDDVLVGQGLATGTGVSTDDALLAGLGNMGGPSAVGTTEFPTSGTMEGVSPEGAMSMGGPPQTALDTPIAADINFGDVPNMGMGGTGSSGWMDTLGKYGGKYLPLMGLGMGSNLLGQYLQSRQNKSNLSDYVGASTWTPDKANTFLNATSANTAGTLAGAGAKTRGTLAESMASAGRGGGGYGAQSLAIDEATLQSLAAARNQGLATVSTPPNLNPGPFMAQSNPYASTMTGMGGAAGNAMTQMMTYEMMKNLGLFKNNQQPA